MFVEVCILWGMSPGEVYNRKIIYDFQYMHISGVFCDDMYNIIQ